MTDRLLGGQLGDRGGDNVGAVAKDGDAVAEGEDFLESMADEEDRDPALAKLADDSEEALDLAGGEGGGRLVHDEDAGVEGERFGDLDELLIGNGEATDGGANIQVDAKGGEQTLDFAVHRSPIDAAEAVAGLASHEDVLGDVEVGEESGVLMDDGDTAAASIEGAMQDNLLAGNAKKAAVGLVDAGQDLDEGRFASAILANKGMDFAVIEGEIDAPECLNRAKVFGDIAQRDDRLRKGCRNLAHCCPSESSRLAIGVDRSIPGYARVGKRKTVRAVSEGGQVFRPRRWLEQQQRQDPHNTLPETSPKHHGD